jgi:hypothetical protein
MDTASCLHTTRDQCHRSCFSCCGRSLATQADDIRNHVFHVVALGLPIAAGILYPSYGIVLSPIIAAAAMSLSSVIANANALRLGSGKL